MGSHFRRVLLAMFYIFLASWQEVDCLQQKLKHKAASQGALENLTNSLRDFIKQTVAKDVEIEMAKHGSDSGLINAPSKRTDAPSKSTDAPREHDAEAGLEAKDTTVCVNKEQAKTAWKGVSDVLRKKFFLAKLLPLSDVGKMIDSKGTEEECRDDTEGGLGIEGNFKLWSGKMFTQGKEVKALMRDAVGERLGSAIYVGKPGMDDFPTLATLKTEQKKKAEVPKCKSCQCARIINNEVKAGSKRDDTLIEKLLEACSAKSDSSGKFIRLCSEGKGTEKYEVPDDICRMAGESDGSDYSVRLKHGVENLSFMNFKYTQSALTAEAASELKTQFNAEMEINSKCENAAGFMKRFMINKASKTYKVGNCFDGKPDKNEGQDEIVFMNSECKGKDSGSAADMEEFLEEGETTSAKLKGMSWATNPSSKEEAFQALNTHYQSGFDSAFALFSSGMDLPSIYEHLRSVMTMPVPHPMGGRLMKGEWGAHEDTHISDMKKVLPEFADFNDHPDHEVTSVFLEEASHADTERCSETGRQLQGFLLILGGLIIIMSVILMLTGSGFLGPAGAALVVALNAMGGPYWPIICGVLMIVFGYWRWSDAHLCKAGTNVMQPY